MVCGKQLACQSYSLFFFFVCLFNFDSRPQGAGHFTSALGVSLVHSIVSSSWRAGLTPIGLRVTDTIGSLQMFRPVAFQENCSDFYLNTLGYVREWKADGNLVLVIGLWSVAVKWTLSAFLFIFNYF